MQVHHFILTLTVGVAFSTAADPRCPTVEDPKNPIHYPHPTECSKFLTCSWGSLVEQNCPEGHLWNDLMKYCDYPENVDCIGMSTPPTHTSTSSNEETTTAELQSSTTTLTTVPAPSDRCPEVYDPYQQVYFPHVDCSKYYICTAEGNKLEQNCPAGLHWSQSFGYCDWPEVAECVSSPETSSNSSATVPTTAPSNPSTATSEEFNKSTSLSTPTGKCPQQFDPNHQFAAHEDCTKFYVCVWIGNSYDAYEIVCPAGLHWNTAESQCDYPELAGCDSNTVTSLTSSTHTTPTTTTEASNEKCPEVYDPYHQVYFPHVDCGKYYICTYEGNKLEQNCPAGLHWNQLLGYCDWTELTQCS